MMSALNKKEMYPLSFIVSKEAVSPSASPSLGETPCHSADT